MYPANFEYDRPETLEEALELLAEHGDDAKIIAGGATLVPLMKLRLVSPERLIDIGRLRELVGESQRDSHLIFGAMTRHVDVEDSASVKDLFPILHELVSQIADRQIRNVGTVGGGVAVVDPGGDWCPGLLALDGSVRCASKRGERTIAARDLFLDAYSPTLEPDELLTDVRFPLPSTNSGGAHLKLQLRAGVYAASCVSVQLTLGDSGSYENVGIGIGGIGTLPLKAVAAEELLKGEQPSEELLRQAAWEISESTEFISDIRGSAEYRQQVTKELFRRALAVAERRARGETVEARYA
jgi:carbon-monoxide dehydrogenase medium subunit